LKQACGIEPGAPSVTMTSQSPSLITTPHNLLQSEQGPALFFQKIFRVYRKEIKLLLWVTAIQMVMRISSILLNNVAQTAFLKRYGVDALPTVFVLEAALTFFFASAVGVLMDRHRTVRVFTGLFLFFAVSVALIRALIPLGNDLIYPILYILKSQAVELLPILYWDILSDLFTTQQSKRLYTLITAGGVLGTTLGSLMTGPVARWVGADNVLLIFVCGMALAALLNEFTEMVAGAPIEPRTDRRKGKLRGKFRENLHEFLAFTRQSSLLKYMILIIAIPNILLPIMTYQFNVVVDEYFASEQATLQFFGLFRGISNATMFAILLFSGRLISRWGLATSLLFHPINYLISFGALFFRFDIFTAIYARFSTETLKTTVNNPARSVLYNFFPEQMRGLIRVFLRGNVVRASDFAGSTFLMLIRNLIDPRLLSLVAFPLTLAWIFTNIRIKRRYASMLIGTLTDKRIDWKHLEEVDFKTWVQDKRSLENIRENLTSDTQEVVLACGEILAKARPVGWVQAIVEALPQKPAETQKRLLDLLRPEDTKEVISTLLELSHWASADSLTYLIPALCRLDPKRSLPVMKEMANHTDPKVRVEGLAGLYTSGDPQSRDLFRERVEALQRQGDPGVRTAVRAMAKSGDPEFSESLLQWVGGEDPELKAWAILGLGKMKHPQALEIAHATLREPNPRLREVAIQVMIDFGEETPLEWWIQVLGDTDRAFREKASAAIRERGRRALKALLGALASPSKTLRNEVLTILDELGAPAVELSQFIHEELSEAYRYLACVHGLEAKVSGRALSLLTERLTEKGGEVIEVVLRVLAITEFGDRMRVILRALQSGNRRDMDNAIEALESSLHATLRKTLIPLLDDRPLEEKLAVGRKRIGTDIPVRGKPETILPSLLDEKDPTVQTLALYSLAESGPKDLSREKALSLLESEHGMVQGAARFALETLNFDPSYQPVLRKDVNLIEKVLSLRKIPIFEDQRVVELMAIASVATASLFPSGSVIVGEGDRGDALYLVMDGELNIIKGMGTQKPILLDRLHKDDFFGEMALVDSAMRSATVRAETDTSLLVLKSEDFTEIMMDYPGIPIRICKMFCGRIRSLHSRLQATRQENLESPVPPA
jgi:ATP/ADP translocase/HEAT repeat protein